MIPTLHSKFKPLLTFHNHFRYFVFYSGRGCGKSQSVAICLILLATMGKHRILCVREIQSSISDSVKHLLEDTILKMKLQHLFKFTRDEIECINGSTFIFKGLRTSNAINIKSISNITITWCEEAEALSTESLNLLLPSVLRVSNSRIVFTFNPRYVDDAVYKMFLVNKPPPYSYIRKLNYDDNKFFQQSGLDDQRKHDLETMPYSEYAYKWLGELRKLSENSLFNIKDIEKNIYPDLPSRQEFYKLIIAVDPATTHKDFSNAYGIIILGARKNGEIWILSNNTKIHTPFSFAVEIDKLYNEWNCDYIVVETNQGGDFIKATLLTHNPLLNIKEVHASKDKIQRASPVSQMLSLGKIKLLDNELSNIKELIKQMDKMTLNGFLGVKGESPDAVDAMVWGVYDLCNLKEKDTINTFFNMEWFLIQKGYDFKPFKPSLFCYSDIHNIICLDYVVVENINLKRRVLINNCFVIEINNIQKLKSLESKYETIWLNEREAFYSLNIENLNMYDDKLDKNLDNSIIKISELLRENNVMFNNMKHYKFQNNHGELLKIALTNFKLEQKKEDVIIKCFYFLVSNIL